MTKKVKGVLVFNNDTRDEMLRRNIGKYSQWQFWLTPAIGEYYDINDNRPLKDLKDGKDLLTYTHDGKTEYSENIEKKYFPNGIKDEYSVRPLTYGELNPWISYQKGDYIQYIDDIFGSDAVMRHVNYVNNLLSGQYIENALRQTEPGVIHDINVAVALQGVITTNPNNMSGKDSVLGQISNRMYAQTLYNGAIFNSDRMKARIKVGEKYYQKQYITPYLVNQYGNNLSNVFELSDIMKIGVNETMIREELGKDVNIIDGYGEGNFADLTKDEFRFLAEEIEASNKLLGLDSATLSTSGGSLWPMQRYSLVNGKGYVNWSKTKEAFRFRDKVDDVDFFSTSIDNSMSGRKAGVYTYSMYNENAEGMYKNLEYLYNSGQYKDLSTDELVNINKQVQDVNNITNNDKNPEPNQFNQYTGIDSTENTLLSKTARLFNNGQLNTLIARFHTDGEEFTKPEFTDTARSSFGNSHGRNLLTLDAAINKPETNGYSNPYCRTWTYHHQYNQVKKMIRPFINTDGDERAYTNKEIQSMNEKYRAYRDGEEGYQSLANNTVLQDNGFVRITPKSGDDKSKIKNCMFSIENLAWKDVLKHPDNISSEQTGPNGGRIMWFPPYDLDFQEGVTVSWNPNTFIGRGEKVYTYTDTERTGTLSFALLIDHPAIINSAAKDSNIGMGQEQDPEADILRFFAGCNLLETVEKEETGTTNAPETKTEIEGKQKDLTVKVYFPNNFSGYVSSKDGKKMLGPDIFNGYVVSDLVGTSAYNPNDLDDYWWRYILVGNNTCVPTDKHLFRGYEMLKNEKEGLLDENAQWLYNNKLCVCKDNKYEVGVLPTNKYTCSIKPNGGKYTYQIDDDLHQVLKNEGSYDDSTSHQLNIIGKLDGQEFGENEYTFAELVIALLSKHETEDKYSQIYKDYRKYVESCGDDNTKTRIDKLANILYSDGTTLDSLTYTGSADSNDGGNANMLAMRRGYVCQELVTRLLGDRINKENVKSEGSYNVGTNSSQPAFTLEQKKDRYCQLTLKYREVIDEKQGDGDASAPASGGTEEISFKTYMQAINDNSPIIHKYVEYISKYDNGRLAKKMQSNYEEFKKSNLDITDSETIKKEIDKILNNAVNRDAIILAYAVCDSSSEFKAKYEKSCDLSDNCYGYACLLDVDGTELGYNRGTKSGMTQHFVAKNATLSEYTGNTGNCRSFTYQLPSELARYSGETPSESYTLNIDRLAYDVVLCSFVEDEYDFFDIKPNYNDSDRYRVRLYELLNNDSTVQNPIDGIIDGCFAGEDGEIIEDDYKTLELYINDGDGTNSIINTLNAEIQQEKEQDRQKAAEQATKIEQQRKDTEENKQAVVEANNEQSVQYGVDTRKKENARYETEGEYFKNIEITDPLLYKSIKKKFQYFNPAYHSISPEGFNARLTFLHQCTRQGQTYEKKGNRKDNTYVSTASNLAFGRMPVCVIRIGDFIHTRAIISNMTINYASNDGIVWDLNSEGAGVQPMYAKISLTITLLGGQSLGAPISRLQNAVSFNYYANAEAYDNRADVAVYNDNMDGNNPQVEYRRIWSPLKPEQESDNKSGVKQVPQDKNEPQVSQSKNNQQDGTWKDLSDEQIENNFEEVNTNNK